MNDELEEICLVPKNVMDFRDEVIRQREEEDSLSRLLSTRPPHARLWDVISIMLLIFSAILMILEPQALFLWLVVAILLYSYNFILILLPTTRRKLRPEERETLKKMGKNDIWLAVRLLLKKRYLAIELGITLFLGGMVPLSLSFAIIMGMGLLMTFYFALVNDLTWTFAFLVVFQLVFILAFYLFVVLLAPHDQGITRLAKSFKRRIDKAREGATRSVIQVYMTMLALVIIAVVLVIGAMLLPGLTLVTILVEIENWGWSVIVMFIFILITQIIVMRHFQSIASRRMVITLLTERVQRFNQEVLDPLEIWTDGGLCHDRAGFRVAFKTLKKNFYSLAIYDVIRVDFFSSSPVYLVGPRLRYLLDEKVLDNF